MQTYADKKPQDTAFDQGLHCLIFNSGISEKSNTRGPLVLYRSPDAKDVKISGYWWKEV